MMLSSLAHSAGAITLFHSPSNTLSVALLNELRKHVATPGSQVKEDKGFWAKLLGSRSEMSSGQYRYKLDVTERSPTAEQFDLIKRYSTTHPYCKEAYAVSCAEAPVKFVKPLVVDWGNSLLATDAQQLSEILKEYGIK